MRLGQLIALSDSQSSSQMNMLGGHAEAFVVRDWIHYIFIQNVSLLACSWVVVLAFPPGPGAVLWDGWRPGAGQLRGAPERSLRQLWCQRRRLTVSRGALWALPVPPSGWNHTSPPSAAAEPGAARCQGTPLSLSRNVAPETPAWAIWREGELLLCHISYQSLRLWAVRVCADVCVKPPQLLAFCLSRRRHAWLAVLFSCPHQPRCLSPRRPIQLIRLYTCSSPCLSRNVWNSASSVFKGWNLYSSSNYVFTCAASSICT